MHTSRQTQARDTRHHDMTAERANERRSITRARPHGLPVSVPDSVQRADLNSGRCDLTSHGGVLESSWARRLASHGAVYSPGASAHMPDCQHARADATHGTLAEAVLNGSAPCLAPRCWPSVESHARLLRLSVALLVERIRELEADPYAGVTEAMWSAEPDETGDLEADMEVLPW